MGERIIVVGGGAAGLIAAGRAAELGAEVLLLEKTARLGNKLGLAGHGRGNISHTGSAAEFVKHLWPRGDFLRNALARFGVDELRAFLAAQGLPTVAETDGRVFPATQQAADVVAALVRYGQSHGVVVRQEAAVAAVLVAEGCVCAVRLTGGEELPTTRVILATGGSSYPATGSSGDGYRIAQALGHRVAPPRPGLVPLVATETWVKQVQGVALADVGATFSHGEDLLAQGRGEMLFTHYGVSGPLILNLSLRLGETLAQGPLRLALDLYPDQSAAALATALGADLARSGKASYHTLVRRWVRGALAEVVVEQSGIPPAQPLSQFSAAQRQLLVGLLKALPLTITRARPWKEAMVTVGGVSTAEVVPQTLASRRVRGLYLAGEVLDLAGESGGYNLQTAFSTGWLAGESAALSLQK
jgi:hypothetical protein